MKEKVYGNIRKIQKLKNFLSTFFTYFILIVVLLAFAICFIVTTTMVTTGDNVGAFLGYSVKVVATGSMSPTIMPGDVVVIHHDDNYKYQTGDVITFTSVDPSIGTYTHRIVANVNVQGENCFLTQGDANNAPDEEYAFYEGIIGKVVLIIPDLGKVVYFIQKIPKWLFMGGLIFVVIIFSTIQLVDIYKYKNEELTEEEKKEAEEVNQYNQMLSFERLVRKILKRDY